MASATSKHLTHPDYRADIDGLRAVAILSVVCFHIFPYTVKGGFVGVDIFFVISGYLISTIIFNNLDNGRFSFLEFYQRRIRRIFPALVCVLAVALVWGWIVPVHTAYKQLGLHIAGGAGFFSNMILWDEAGYFDNSSITKPLMHLWSLAIEEQFYIFWPLMCWFAAKKQFNRLSLCVGIIVVSLALNLRMTATHPVEAFYSPFTRFWELTLGSLLAYVTLYKPAFYTRLERWTDALLGRIIYHPAPAADGTLLPNVKSLLGALLIFLVVFRTIPSYRYPGWWVLLPTVGAFLLISAGRDAWFNRRVLSNRVIVWIGLISYPLYLWHWLLWSFAYVQGDLSPQSPKFQFGFFAASIVLAWLTYWLVEKPLRFGGFGKTKAAVLLACMAVIGSGGYYVYRHDGMAERFPPIVRDILEYQYTFTRDWRVGACFLEPELKQEFLDCSTNPPASNPRSIVIWGDSYAASLSPGFRKVFGDKERVTQRTAKGCPPILDYEGSKYPINPYCKHINDSTFEYIKSEKTDRVVLAGSWYQYDDWRQVDKTVKKLRQIGIKRIDLIGVFPDWAGVLPQVFYNYYRTDPEHRVPERIDYRYVTAKNDLEAELEAYSKIAGINYISVTRMLCNKDGCLARLGDTAESLTSMNNHHLTSMASEYVVARFPK